MWPSLAVCRGTGDREKRIKAPGEISRRALRAPRRRGSPARREGRRTRATRRSIGCATATPDTPEPGRAVQSQARWPNESRLISRCNGSGFSATRADAGSSSPARRPTRSKVSPGPSGTAPTTACSTISRVGSTRCGGPPRPRRSAAAWLRDDAGRFDIAVDRVELPRGLRLVRADRGVEIVAPLRLAVGHEAHRAGPVRQAAQAAQAGAAPPPPRPPDPGLRQAKLRFLDSLSGRIY